MAGPGDPTGQEKWVLREDFDHMVRDYELLLLNIGKRHACAGVHDQDPADGAQRLADHDKSLRTALESIKAVMVEARDCLDNVRSQDLLEVANHKCLFYRQALSDISGIVERVLAEGS